MNSSPGRTTQRGPIIVMGIRQVYAGGARLVQYFTLNRIPNMRGGVTLTLTALSWAVVNGVP